MGYKTIFYKIVVDAISFLYFATTYYIRYSLIVILIGKIILKYTEENLIIEMKAIGFGYKVRFLMVLLS